MIKTLSKDLIDGFYKTFDEACQGHAKLLGLKLYAKNIEELRKQYYRKHGYRSIEGS